MDGPMNGCTACVSNVVVFAVKQSSHRFCDGDWLRCRCLGEVDANVIFSVATMVRIRTSVLNPPRDGTAFGNKAERVTASAVRL